MDNNSQQTISETTKKSAEYQQAVKAGLTASQLEYIFAITGNRYIASESLEVGDKFTIKKIAENYSSFVINPDTDARTVNFLPILTEGDRGQISLTQLVGTSKSKYFAEKRNANKMEYDTAKVLQLPRRPLDALLYVQSNLIDHTLQLVEIAENCGKNNDRTYYRFIDITE